MYVMLHFCSIGSWVRDDRDGAHGTKAQITDSPLVFVPEKNHVGQEFGSLYDLLHNETVPIERETMLQLFRDISQGAGPPSSLELVSTVAHFELCQGCFTCTHHRPLYATLTSKAQTSCKYPALTVLIYWILCGSPLRLEFSIF
jgi:hypothetical protein